MDPEAPVDDVTPPPFPQTPPERRRFSWRDFVIGVVAGAMLVVGGFILLVIIVGVIASRVMNKDGAGDDAFAPVPAIPAHAERTVYGQADPAWTYKTLDGAATTLADAHGKVVFLNFWATWCGPCVEEMPSIQRLEKKMAGQDVAFVLVSDETPNTIRQFLTKRKLQLISFRSEADAPALFDVKGIPTTVLINRQGNVVFRHVGMARWDHDSVVSFLTRLAAEKAD